MQYLIIEGWVRLGIAFHERHIRLERLTGRAWCTKSQSSLLNEFFSSLMVPDLSDLSPYLFTSATVRIRVLWTHQFFDPLFTPFAPLQKLRLNHPFLCVNKSPIRYGFFAGAILSYPQTYPS